MERLNDYFNVCSLLLVQNGFVVLNKVFGHQKIVYISGNETDEVCLVNDIKRNNS